MADTRFRDGSGSGTGVSHSVEGHTVEGHTVEGHTVDCHTVEGHTVEGHSVEGHTVDCHTVDGHSVDGHSVEAHDDKAVILSWLTRWFEYTKLSAEKALTYIGDNLYKIIYQTLATLIKSSSATTYNLLVNSEKSACGKSVSTPSDIEIGIDNSLTTHIAIYLSTVLYNKQLAIVANPKSIVEIITATAIMGNQSTITIIRGALSAIETYNNTGKGAKAKENMETKNKEAAQAVCAAMSGVVYPEISVINVDAEDIHTDRVVETEIAYRNWKTAIRISDQSYKTLIETILSFLSDGFDANTYSVSAMISIMSYLQSLICDLYVLPKSDRVTNALTDIYHLFKNFNTDNTLSNYNSNNLDNFESVIRSEQTWYTEENDGFYDNETEKEAIDKHAAAMEDFIDGCSQDNKVIKDIGDRIRKAYELIRVTINCIITTYKGDNIEEQMMVLGKLKTIYTFITALTNINNATEKAIKASNKLLNDLCVEIDTWIYKKPCFINKDINSNYDHIIEALKNSGLVNIYTTTAKQLCLISEEISIYTASQSDAFVDDMYKIFFDKDICNPIDHIINAHINYERGGSVSQSNTINTAFLQVIRDGEHKCEMAKVLETKKIDLSKRSVSHSIEHILKIVEAKTGGLIYDDKRIQHITQSVRSMFLASLSNIIDKQQNAMNTSSSGNIYCDVFSPISVPPVYQNDIIETSILNTMILDSLKINNTVGVKASIHQSPISAQLRIWTPSMNISEIILQLERIYGNLGFTMS